MCQHCYKQTSVCFFLPITSDIYKPDYRYYLLIYYFINIGMLIALINASMIKRQY